jgi:hypothetical protein
MNYNGLPETTKEYLDAMNLADQIFTQKDEYWEDLRRQENYNPNTTEQAKQDMIVARNMFWIVNSEFKKRFERPPSSVFNLDWNAFKWFLIGCFVSIILKNLNLKT